MSQRLQSIDTMRAIALFGVVMINIGSMVMRFNGRTIMADAGAADIAVVVFQVVLFMGKARSAFAFLFGMGFAIMARDTANDFSARHRRRMLALLAIGIVNQCLLFWGDILVTYALLGLLLPLTLGWSNRRVLRAGIALVLVPPLLQGLVVLTLGGAVPPLVAMDRAADATAGLAAVTAPAYVDYVAYIALDTVREHINQTPHILVYETGLLGLFLLGAWAVRVGIPFDVPGHRVLLRRVAGIGIPLGLVLAPLAGLPFFGVRAEGALLAASTAAFVASPLLALGTLALLALWFERGATRLQALLAPLGRLSLTGYLGASIVGGLVLHGYGLALLTAMRPPTMLMLAIAIWAGLLIFSHAWLSEFRIGPAEWLWRSLAARKSLPFRTSPTPARA